MRPVRRGLEALRGPRRRSAPDPHRALSGSWARRSRPRAPWAVPHQSAARRDHRPGDSS